MMMIFIVLVQIFAMVLVSLLLFSAVQEKGYPLFMNLQTFASAGKNASFKIGANAIGGLNDGNITINGETIDVTTFASGGWIEKIQGLKSAEISLSGFWLSDDTNGQTALRTALLDGTTVTMNALLDGTNGWTGSFYVTSFEAGAAVDGEVSASISLESTGAVAVVGA